MVEEVRGSTNDGREEADALFGEAVDISPDDSQTVADYGRFKLVCCKDYSTAEKLLRKSIKMDDGCIVGNYNLGILLLNDSEGKGSDIEGALTSFATVVKVEPTHVEACRYWPGYTAGKTML